MITFREYAQKFSKKYVCLTFTDETNRKLMKYALDNGFNLSVSYDGSEIDPKQFDFHITVYYTTSEDNHSDITEQPLTPFEVNISNFDLLGKELDVPVLLVKKDNLLNKIRSEFTKIGYRDAWPNWKPHISLSYERKKYKAPSKLPDFPIIVNKLSVSNQT